MPNCDFFACGEDHRLILEHLLDEGNCDIYELASSPGQACRTFSALADFEGHYEITDWRDISRSMYLQLHPHSAGGRVQFKQTKLTFPPAPDKTFTCSTGGWGLVQLYLEAPRRGCLSSSHTNHNSETRAGNWQEICPELGDPGDWNWAEVNGFSRRLNAFIRKQAVDKIKSQVVLRHAAAQRASGMKLWPWDQDKG